jgi:hypothetical protein
LSNVGTDVLVHIVHVDKLLERSVKRVINQLL